MSTILEAKFTFYTCSQQQKQALEMAAKEWSDSETFQFRNVHCWLDWEEITSYRQKHFWETKNCLCQVSIV